MPSVALFDPCYMAALRPTDAECARHVLTSLGDEVELIDGRCCGQPAFNSGYRDQARTSGREVLKAARAFDTVVTLSGSCTSMVRHYLPGLWDGERREAAQGIANRFHDFVSYVANHPNVGKLGLRLDGVVAYHDSCHGRRELGITADAIGLLGRVQSLEVRRLAYEEECCGFGGSFAVKLPEISVAMMTAKLDDVVAAGAKVLVSGDYSCLAHLEAGAKGVGIKLETWTFAELLSRALE
jgi:L-lactate dehydrogenase complex protein LldE